MNFTEDEQAIVKEYEQLIARKKREMAPVKFSLYFHGDDTYVAHETAWEVLSNHLRIELDRNDPIVTTLAEKIYNFSYEVKVQMIYQDGELKAVGVG